MIIIVHTSFCMIQYDFRASLGSISISSYVNTQLINSLDVENLSLYLIHSPR